MNSVIRSVIYVGWVYWIGIIVGSVGCGVA